MKTTDEGRTRMNGRLLEDMGVVVPTFNTDWLHYPVEPFRVQMINASDPFGEYSSWDAPSLEYALGVFCEVGLPVREGVTLVVIDESFRVVLGYMTMHGGLAATGMGWWGTAEAFTILRNYGNVHEVDLAVWESIARGYVR